MKLEGRIDWVTDDRKPLTGTAPQHKAAAALDGALSLSAEYEGNRFSGSLSARGVDWRGTLRTPDGGRRAEVTGKLYKSHENPEEWLFFGHWLEEGVDYVCWAELDELEDGTP